MRYIKHLPSVLLFLLLTTGCSSQYFAPSPVSNTAQSHSSELVKALNNPHGKVLTVAHRGCWKDAPENSIAALEACIDKGVDIVEVDLRLLKDGNVIVFHDKSLKRMTGDTRRIQDMTYQQLQQLQLKQSNGKGVNANVFTHHKIPLFKEYLAVNKGRVLLDLDLKSEIQALSRAVSDILVETENCSIALFPLVAPPNEVLPLSGPLKSCAAYIANIRPYMGSMSQVSTSYQSLKPIAIAVRFDNWQYLLEGQQAVKHLPTRLWVNTLSKYHAAGLTDSDALIDPEQLWGRLIKNGVNIIQTDEPEALISYLKTVKDRR